MYACMHVCIQKCVSAYRVAKIHRMPYLLLVIFHKRALELVALLQKMSCNLRHPMHLRHPVFNAHMQIILCVHV